MEPYWSAMSRLALRLVGSAQWEDVLQESLVLAWRKRASFDPARGSVRAWLLALVVDKAGKQRRRDHREAYSGLRDTGALGQAESSTADADRRMDLDQALRQLTSRQRVAVELYYFLGLPITETAQVMGCSSGTVKSTLSDARGRLRTQLKVGTDV